MGQVGTKVSARRAALAEFLRARRAQVVRATVGLPANHRGATIGLTREEVAYHSAISVTWYTWLEQARESRPSREVVEAIARTLQLDGRERTYVLELAGYVSAARTSYAADGRAPASVQRLLDGIDPNPAYVIFPDWSFAGWNAAYEAMYPMVGRVDPAERNLLLLIFTDPSVRELMPDWADSSHRFLSEFRAEAGPYLTDPRIAAVLERLLAKSPEFRAGWESHDLELFSARPRRFRHPVAGDLSLEHHRVTPTDHPDLGLVIYTPASADDAAALAGVRR